MMTVGTADRYWTVAPMKHSIKIKVILQLDKKRKQIVICPSLLTPRLKVRFETPWCPHPHDRGSSAHHARLGIPDGIKPFPIDRLKRPNNRDSHKNGRKRPRYHRAAHPRAYPAPLQSRQPLVNDFRSDERRAHILPRPLRRRQRRQPSAGELPQNLDQHRLPY